MRRFYRFYTGRLGTALLLLRLIVGIAFVLHGWPKVQDTAAFAGMMHLPLWLGTVAAWVEVVGGALLLLGLLTPLAALLLTAQMIATFPAYHIPQHTPFINPSGPNYELALVYLVVGLVYLLTGPGAFSVDACLFGPERVKKTARAYNRRRGLA
jgi:putative oxidoreductase